MIKKYTIDELLIIAVAREINNYDNVILGVGLPTTAGALAKALHAPQANLMMEAGMIDFEPLIPPNHIADVMACKGYACATDLFTTFTMTYRGFVDICFLGVGQIDKYGNLNTTCIGDYYKPDLRLPGSGGAADFISYSKRAVLTMRGGEFVQKLDYLTSPGYLDGGDARDRCGLFPAGSGPSRLITQKGIFEFDPATKEMVLTEIHPRNTVEDIQKDIPWELKISENLAETNRPGDEEIDFIRQFAPAAVMGRALSTETALANLTRGLQEREKN